MNEKVLHTLEYDKIIFQLKRHTVSSVGEEYADALCPTDALADAQTLLQQTIEADVVCRRTGSTPILAFPDVRTLLGKLHAALFLTTGELLNIAQLMKAAREARNVLQGGDGEGLLYNMANQLASRRSIEEEIARCIPAEDEISDQASPELSRIRRQMKIVNERMRDKLNSMIKSTATQKYLQEPIITMRNGRYALPVKAEYRAQVPGLIQDQSSSGATLFIEPAAVVELGNDLKRMLLEEKTEIERVLTGLTALIAPYDAELSGSIVVLGTLDLIFAKAILAQDMNAHMPLLNDEQHIHIYRGRHPLLPKESVVPVDIWLGEEFSTLVITGPNTGGKTVTLKTVGLLTLMAMSGMFVPAEEGTVLSVFTQVFADIGDEQSIEQSLSTFSSHMKNNVSILNNADAHSLVLLDELGAGTDPVEGAALAQAILESLSHRHALTVATTHYSEIKAFALTHSGMQNASMEFDVDRLCPTYRLFVGIPGKSNAFEISRRLGLNDDIISRAHDYLEKKDVAFETVLSEAEQARRAAEQERETAQQARWESERIRGELAYAQQKLNDEKALLRQKARDDARRSVQETRQEMEQLIAELRSIRNIDKQELERAVQKTRDKLRLAEDKMYEQSMRRNAVGEAPKTVKTGDLVHILSVDQEATVLKAPDNRGDVMVQAGIIKMSIPLADLRMTESKKEKQKTASKVMLATEQVSVMELDLRGKMVDEACIEIDRFIDNAARTGINELTIIHGKGTGALRAGVQSYLKRNARVKSYRMGAYGEGDAGVTIITLKS
ncbi:MAG: endonuclease MutS2 [Clostridia bacterium]